MATDEPENLVLRELRKLRADMQKEFAKVRAEVSELRAETNARFDRMEANGMKMWRTFIGNRAITERGVASLAEDYERLTGDYGGLKSDVSDLKQRVAKLEAAAT
jgi:hypothetical protein